jgi:hypothetical protein
MLVAGITATLATTQFAAVQQAGYIVPLMYQPIYLISHQ